MQSACRGAMNKRYRKPAEPPPSLEFLEAYLRDAQPTLSERLANPDATEAQRVDAVAALLALARAALVEAGPNRLGAIPSELRDFLQIEGLRILTADDPIAALQCFLGQARQGRGRPSADNAFRDLMIAADVAELHASGKTVTAALNAVAAAAALSFEAVREIYYD